MKVIILAGGLGTRLSEETTSRPKPMVTIGGRPILWHIMKIFSTFGFNDFVICLGYKGYVIKEYFANYYLHQSDVTFDIANNKLEIHNNSSEPWKVTLIDTGEGTMTGGRLLRVKEYIDSDTFMLTYGDGVADINISDLLTFHKKHGRFATVTAAQPSGRFGALKIESDNTVSNFKEKPTGDGSWVNAGFFVLNAKVFDYLSDDSTVFEQDPLKNLSNDGELKAFHHSGFWMPMDKLSDKVDLEKLWTNNSAPWKVWK